MREKRNRVWRLALCAVLCTVLAVAAGIAWIPVSAEEAADPAATEVPLKDSSDASGIRITTSTDKKYYRDGDTALVTVSVTNTNEYEMTDVGVTCELPVNFSVEQGQNSQTIDKLAAGETKEFQISTVVAKQDEGEIVWASYFTLSTIILAVLVAAVIVAAVFLLLRRKKKKASGTGISMLLILALLSACISYAADPATLQAKTDTAGQTEDGLAEDKDYSRITVHDPSIVKDPESGYYYIFGSHRAFAKTKDLMEWEQFSHNILSEFEELCKEPWEWAKFATRQSGDQLGGRMWAPDVIWNETMKKWCMYMSIDGDNWCSSICLLTADKIEGPYAYNGIVVYSGMNNAKTPPDQAMLEKTDLYKVLDKKDDLSRYRSTSNACINAIDPCVRFDDKGDLYMVYGSWSAGIYMLKLDTKTGLRDYDTTYKTEMDVSDAYLGTKIAGGHYNSGEAPYILHIGKYYYLFLSYGGFDAAKGYQMRIYRSEKITGPYVDQNGADPICKNSENMEKSTRGIRIFGSYDIPGVPQVQVAQGHNSALLDDDGKAYLVYHTRFQSETGEDQLHQVRVHQLFVNEDGWLVAAPYEYGGETLPEKGYSADEVAGEYKFIYHEPTEYYNVVAGKQYGIAGSQEFSTKEVELRKELVVGHRKTAIGLTVSYSHAGAEKVVLKKDGTVTGDYCGTWKTTNGSNVVMELNGVTYKGVFLEQQDESVERKKHMTFSLLGDNVTVWGVQP